MPDVIPYVRPKGNEEGHKPKSGAYKKKGGADVPGAIAKAKDAYKAVEDKDKKAKKAAEDAIEAAKAALDAENDAKGAEESLKAEKAAAAKEAKKAADLAALNGIKYKKAAIEGAVDATQASAAEANAHAEAAKDLVEWLNSEYEKANLQIKNAESKFAGAETSLEAAKSNKTDAKINKSIILNDGGMKSVNYTNAEEAVKKVISKYNSCSNNVKVCEKALNDAGWNLSSLLAAVENAKVKMEQAFQYVEQADAKVKLAEQAKENVQKIEGEFQDAEEAEREAIINKADTNSENVVKELQDTRKLAADAKIAHTKTKEACDAGKALIAKVNTHTENAIATADKAVADAAAVESEKNKTDNIVAQIGLAKEDAKGAADPKKAKQLALGKVAGANLTPQGIKKLKAKIGTGADPVKPDDMPPSGGAAAGVHPPGTPQLAPYPEVDSPPSPGIAGLEHSLVYSGGSPISSPSFKPHDNLSNWKDLSLFEKSETLKANADAKGPIKLADINACMKDGVISFAGVATALFDAILEDPESNVTTMLEEFVGVFKEEFEHKLDDISEKQSNLQKKIEECCDEEKGLLKQIHDQLKSGAAGVKAGGDPAEGPAPAAAAAAQQAKDDADAAAAQQAKDDADAAAAAAAAQQAKDDADAAAAQQAKDDADAAAAAAAAQQAKDDADAAAAQQAKDDADAAAAAAQQAKDDADAAAAQQAKDDADAAAAQQAKDDADAAAAAAAAQQAKDDADAAAAQQAKDDADAAAAAAQQAKDDADAAAAAAQQAKDDADAAAAQQAKDDADAAAAAAAQQAKDDAAGPGGDDIASELVDSIDAEKADYAQTKAGVTELLTQYQHNPPFDLLPRFVVDGYQEQDFASAINSENMGEARRALMKMMAEVASFINKLSFTENSYGTEPYPAYFDNMEPQIKWTNAAIFKLMGNMCTYIKTQKHVEMSSLGTMLDWSEQNFPTLLQTYDKSLVPNDDDSIKTHIKALFEHAGTGDFPKLLKGFFVDVLKGVQPDNEEIKKLSAETMTPAQFSTYCVYLPKRAQLLVLFFAHYSMDFYGIEFHQPENDVNYSILFNMKRAAIVLGQLVVQISSKIALDNEFFHVGNAVGKYCSDVVPLPAPDNMKGPFFLYVTIIKIYSIENTAKAKKRFEKLKRFLGRFPWGYLAAASGHTHNIDWVLLSFYKSCWQTEPTWVRQSIIETYNKEMLWSADCSLSQFLTAGLKWRDTHENDGDESFLAIFQCRNYLGTPLALMTFNVGILHPTVDVPGHARYFNCDAADLLRVCEYDASDQYPELRQRATCMSLLTSTAQSNAGTDDPIDPYLVMDVLGFNKQNSATAIGQLATTLGSQCNDSSNSINLDASCNAIINAHDLFANMYPPESKHETAFENTKTMLDLNLPLIYKWEKDYEVAVQQTTILFDTFKEKVQDKYEGAFVSMDKSDKLTCFDYLMEADEEFKEVYNHIKSAIIESFADKDYHYKGYSFDDIPEWCNTRMEVRPGDYAVVMINPGDRQISKIIVTSGDQVTVETQFGSQITRPQTDVNVNITNRGNYKLSQNAIVLNVGVYGNTSHKDALNNPGYAAMTDSSEVRVLKYLNGCVSAVHPCTTVGGYCQLLWDDILDFDDDLPSLVGEDFDESKKTLIIYRKYASQSTSVQYARIDKTSLLQDVFRNGDTVYVDIPNKSDSEEIPTAVRMDSDVYVSSKLKDPLYGHDAGAPSVLNVPFVIPAFGADGTPSKHYVNPDVSGAQVLKSKIEEYTANPMPEIHSMEQHYVKTDISTDSTLYLNCEMLERVYTISTAGQAQLVIKQSFVDQEIAQWTTLLGSNDAIGYVTTENLVSYDKTVSHDAHSPRACWYKSMQLHISSVNVAREQGIKGNDVDKLHIALLLASRARIGEIFASDETHKAELQSVMDEIDQLLALFAPEEVEKANSKLNAPGAGGAKPAPVTPANGITAGALVVITANAKYGTNRIAMVKRVNGATLHLYIYKQKYGTTDPTTLLYPEGNHFDPHILTKATQKQVPLRLDDASVLATECELLIPADQMPPVEVMKKDAGKNMKIESGAIVCQIKPNTKTEIGPAYLHFYFVKELHSKNMKVYNPDGTKRTLSIASTYLMRDVNESLWLFPQYLPNAQGSMGDTLHVRPGANARVKHDYARNVLAPHGHLESPVQLSFTSGVKTIGANAFAGASNVVGRLNLPHGLTHIESGAFQGTSVSDVSIPNSTRLIESNAFSNCDELPNSVEVPASAIIMPNAFPERVKLVLC